MPDMRNFEPDQIQPATNETPREINRRILLNLVRLRQEVSRADLARLTGLQRSTVSLITEELIGERWLIEGPPQRLPRGRHPRHVSLNPQRAIIGIDLRPTVTTLALADLHGNLLWRETFPTAGEPQAAIAEMITRLQGMMLTRPDVVFDGIGVSLPGRVSLTTEHLVFTPNLHWPAFDLKRPIENATGLHVQLENAANICVLAEVWFGQWVRVRDLAIVTVSEGIGSGLYANGQLVRGGSGMAGEFGHVTLDPEGPLCSCGRHGCWEAFASQGAALRYYHELSGRAAPPFPRLLTMAGEGDAHAIAALSKMADYLARGMCMIVGGFAPEMIIVIGELTRAWHLFEPALQAQTARQSLSGPPPRILPGGEGSTTRLRGTVALVLQKHFDVSPLLLNSQV